MKLDRGYHSNLTYAAEHAVWDGAKAKKYREPIGVWQAKEIAKSLGIAIEIKRYNGQHGSGHYYPAHDGKPPKITLSRHSGTWVVLHELAHALAWPLGYHGHDEGFRAFYVGIVRLHLGEYWADRLHKSFERHGLKVGI